MTLAVDLSSTISIPVTRVRTRARAVDTSAPEVNVLSVPKDLDQAVKELIRLNQLANDATAIAKKQRDTVEKLVSTHRLDGRLLSTDTNGVTYDYGITSAVEDEVDVTKLKELVSADIFMKIVGASKKAVEDHAGTVIMNQSLSKVTKNPSFKCAKRKKGALNG